MLIVALSNPQGSQSHPRGQEVTEPAVLLLDQLLGSGVSWNLPPKCFLRKSCNTTQHYPPPSWWGFILCFEHPGFSREQIDSLGDSEGIRDEIKAKARAVLSV